MGEINLLLLSINLLPSGLIVILFFFLIKRTKNQGYDYLPKIGSAFPSLAKPFAR
jgi:hypothetical protein